ncbi:MAG: response regulator [Acidobacteriota bacterium]|jgi:DNA-binding response OmpR family regulator|nr:response regulator [Acidobacteriota bacterium]
MSKKVIVLADNSYTIRRIVELSFSEIDNIEVRSFENGSGIREKLLQLNPAVVIVDIKLPETNGYDVCRFINETPALKGGRVFLMKGSFEPVDNEMIKNLKYEDIITKPFDSNALVAAVMKIINQEEPVLVDEFPAEGPTSFPEEFPEIETEAPESEDISFSDIRGVMDAPLAAPPVAPPPAAPPPPPEHDEILPSEEITQGTQPLRDNLMLQEADEPFKNPFEEEPAFEEINPSSAAGQPASLEFEQDSLAVGEGRDASDEFHDRFLEIANEDTSEDILKTPLETLLPADTGEQQFPADMEEEKPLKAEEKLSLEFEEPGMVVDTLDFFAAKKKESTSRDLERLEEEIVKKEPVLEKTRPETHSPQDELALLTVKPKKEARTEPAAAVPEKFAMTDKLEDKLSQTIKQLLWEIVPPLAEKIIKEEIEKIKSDLNDSGL